MLLAAISSLAVAVAPPPTLWISHTAARVRVIPEARVDVVATVTPGRADAPMPAVRRTAGGAVVDAGLPAMDWRPVWLGGFGCSGDGVQVKGKAFKAQELPLVTVRTPLNVNVIADGTLYGEVGP